ncbi:MAG: hypothetical protein J6Z01_04365 [Bacteroidales bacterium]|nr:hypothetical protein [Bacteroidales bacterium]
MKPIEVSIHNEEIAYLKEFIDICKSNNIKLSFVYAPEYIEASQYVTNRDSFKNFIREIAYKNDIPFADFSQYDFCKDTTLFCNMRHLNSHGADKFTSEYYVPWIKKIYGL